MIADNTGEGYALEATEAEQSALDYSKVWHVQLHIVCNPSKKKWSICAQKLPEVEDVRVSCYYFHRTTVAPLQYMPIVDWSCAGELCRQDNSVEKETRRFVWSNSKNVSPGKILEGHDRRDPKRNEACRMVIGADE